MKNNKKTVLITGAGQGIGQAIAYRFASEGANLVIASKDDSSLCLERVTIAYRQGTSEEQKFVAKSTQLNINLFFAHAIIQNVLFHQTEKEGFISCLRALGAKELYFCLMQEF